MVKIVTHILVNKNYIISTNISWSLIKMNKRNFLIIFSTHTVYSTILVIRETMLLMVMGGFEPPTSAL